MAPGQKEWEDQDEVGWALGGVILVGLALISVRDALTRVVLWLLGADGR
jgi:hypothetical protein